nr:MAG TPA: hypothetical protein [Caudoviricetes sp.]
MEFVRRTPIQQNDRDKCLALILYTIVIIYIITLQCGIQCFFVASL